jgi:pyruvate dehydrogenase E2 component (dihydrolipoamide acetyltransferase)
LALQRVPAANCTWTADGTLRHHNSDIGVAVSVEGGLFTPVICKAEAKTLSQISTEMKRLTVRARERKLLPAEYRGGTTAISNLGMFGVEQFAAIISPPHASILAVGAGLARPAIVNGTVAVRTRMTCTLSCDHRVIDGALGAELLAAFRNFVECPALMLA